MSFAIPLQRLREGQDWLAFYHPTPSYPFHVLLLPRQTVARLAELDPAGAPRLDELFSMVQSLVAQFRLEETGYRLVVNGGAYQDIPQLHFHLVSEQKPPSG